MSVGAFINNNPFGSCEHFSHTIHIMTKNDENSWAIDWAEWHNVMSKLCCTRGCKSRPLLSGFIGFNLMAALQCIHEPTSKGLTVIESHSTGPSWNEICNHSRDRIMGNVIVFIDEEVQEDWFFRCNWKSLFSSLVYHLRVIFGVNYDYFREWSRWTEASQVWYIFTRVLDLLESYPGV